MPRGLGKGGGKPSKKGSLRQAKKGLGLPAGVVAKYHSFFPPDFEKSLERSWLKFRNSGPGHVRVKARKLSTEHWGSGLDEMYATRLLTENPSNFPINQLEELYYLRVRTSHLVWVTKDGSSISGHPGALKNHTGRANKGSITAEHGTRDVSREAAIEAETNDSNRVKIKAKLATIKDMMSPGEDFVNPSLTVSMSKTETIHHNSKAIGNLIHESERKLLAPKIQEAREPLKWSAALDLLKDRTLTKLVPPEYQTYLKPGKTAEQARADYENDIEANPNKRKGRNRSIGSQTDDLGESLDEIARKNKRALSPPRSAKRIGEI